MTTQFHEGQEVEVPDVLINGQPISWRKAKILTVSRPNEPPQTCSVILPNGTRAVVDAAQIKAVSP